jgi:arylsulfatase A-like enzyme
VESLTCIGGLAVLAAAAGIALACGSSRHETTASGRWNRIGGQSVERFEIVRSIELESLHEHSILEQLESGAWSVDAPSVPGGEAGSAVLRASNRRVMVDLGAFDPLHDCHALEVSVDGLVPSGQVELVEQGLDADSAALVTVERRDASGDGAFDRFLFLLPAASVAVAGNRGVALRIRGTGDSIRLGTVRCLGIAPFPDAVAPLEVGDAQRIDLDNEVRSGWVFGSGRSFEHEVELPLEPRLRGVVGRILGGRSKFVLELIPLEPGRSEEPSHRVVLEIPAGPGWSPFDVSLSSPVGGARAMLRIRLEDEGEQRSIAALGSLELGRTARRERWPIVALLSVDTFAASGLSIYGSSRLTTPNIDRWALRSAALFENAIAAAPSTLPAHASMFTGLDVLRHGTVLGLPLPRDLTTIAQRLTADGWSSVAITGGGFLHPMYELDRGFDVYRYWPRRPGSNDAELADGVDRAIRWVEAAADRPLFLFFHTYHVHAPYRAEEPAFSTWTGDRSSKQIDLVALAEESGQDALLRSKGYRIRDGDVSSTLTESEHGVARNYYESGIATLDRELARLLESLERASQSGRKTLIVLTSDHGEAFGENGVFGHGYLYDTNLRVPLLVAWPDGDGAGRRIADQVRTVDLVPTLIEAAGLSPVQDLDGMPLRALLRGGEQGPRAAWSYSAETNHGLALRRQGSKVIYRDSAFERAEARTEKYDLDADPGEERRLEASDDDLRTLHRYWLDARSGVLVRVDGSARRSFRGSLTLAGMDRISLKSVVRVGEVDLLDQGSRARLALSPASSLVLRQFSGDRRATIGMSSGGDAPRLETIPREALCRARVSLDRPDGIDLLEIFARDRCKDLGVAPIDAEVERSLRALGYIQ